MKPVGGGHEGGLTNFDVLVVVVSLVMQCVHQGAPIVFKSPDHSSQQLVVKLKLQKVHFLCVFRNDAYW